MAPGSERCFCYAILRSTTPRRRNRPYRRVVEKLSWATLAAASGLAKGWFKVCLEGAPCNQECNDSGSVAKACIDGLIQASMGQASQCLVGLYGTAAVHQRSV